MRSPLITTVCAFLLMGLLATDVHAQTRKKGKTDFALLIPYLYGERIEFEGGAAADIESDPGIGFGFAYYFSEQLAGRFDLVWNSTGFSAERVLDDGSGTVEVVGGRLDAFNLVFGGDYYLTRSKVAPFVNANLGWTFVNTDIPSGAPIPGCWWDPWWGYVCGSVRPTHGDTSFFYGAGLGLRADLSRNLFGRLGYYQTWLDLDHARGTPTLNTTRFEFGVLY